jgi:peptidyl-prolyl cis-trans isomerase SurA
MSRVDRVMKPLSLRIAILLMFAAMVAAPTHSQEILDGVAAVVNGDVITYSQVRELVGAREEAARQMLSGQELVNKVKELRESALQDLIDRQLVLQEFKKKGLQVPDYVLDDRINEIIRDEFGGDRSAFLRTLSAQGYSLSRFRQIEMEKVKVQAMRHQSLNSKLVVPPRRIEEYYREHIADYTVNAQVKLLMIVLPQSSGDGPEAQKKVAEELRRRIQEGADFGDLARLYSEDSTAETGGDWGWIEEKTLNETLSKAAFRLDAGEVSPVIEFGGNYYLLYAEAKKNAKTQPLSEVREEIKKRLEQEQQVKQMTDWIKNLREKAYIKTF